VQTRVKGIREHLCVCMNDVDGLTGHGNQQPAIF